MNYKQSILLSQYIHQFEKAKKEAKAFLEPLDDRIFRRQPSAKGWCIGECFSHLVETGNLYLKKVEQGISQGLKNSAQEGETSISLRFHMRWFVNYLSPPVSIKTKAPKPFQPSEYAKLNKDEVLTSFLELQDQFLAQLKLAESNNLDLNKIKVSNPLISIIRMTVGECVAVTEAHQRRHMEQAQKTLKQIEGMH